MRPYGWSEGPHPSACRVCGWDLGEPGWNPDPLYIICECCGAESGVDDIDEESARLYLRSWAASGGPWFDPSKQPNDWSMTEYLQRTGLTIRRADLRDFPRGHALDWHNSR